jgi:hypothetical protein
MNGKFHVVFLHSLVFASLLVRQSASSEKILQRRLHRMRHGHTRNTHLLPCVTHVTLKSVLAHGYVRIGVSATTDIHVAVLPFPTTPMHHSLCALSRKTMLRLIAPESSPFTTMLVKNKYIPGVIRAPREARKFSNMI